MDSILCFWRKSRPTDRLAGEKQLFSDDESECSFSKPAQEPRVGPFSALRAWFQEPLVWWDHRSDDEVEQVRRRIDDHRRRWERAMATWESAVDFAHLRQEAWAEGTDVEGWEHHPHFSFDPGHRYAVQASQAARDCLGVPRVLDFRTPEGRQAAVAWFELGAARQRSARRVWDARYDRWEAAYERWLREDGRRRRERARRELLSRLDVPAEGNTIGFKQLPD